MFFWPTSKPRPLAVACGMNCLPKMTGNRWAVRFAAFCSCGRTLGIYQKLNPRVSMERALLEVLHELGAIHPSRYRRLVLAIGEQPGRQPDVNNVPVWKQDQGELILFGQVIRTIEQPTKACNIVAILDAFERLKWAAVVPISEVRELPPFAGSDSVYKLNRGLKAIRFSMNGSGNGIRWKMI